MALFNLTELRARLGRDQRLIGLDPGAKTIGVALTDMRLTLATPYASLRRGKLRDNAAEVASIARKEGAGGLVVGLPLSMDGTAGPAAQAAKDWTLALSEATGLPAALWDERLSTAAVNRFLIGEADLSRKKRAEAVDRAAAAWMLQSALDASREDCGAAQASLWSAHGPAHGAGRGQAPADHSRLPGRGAGKRRGSSAFAEDDED